MLDENNDPTASSTDQAAPPTTRTRRRAVSRPAGPPSVPNPSPGEDSPAPSGPTAAGDEAPKKKAPARKRAAKKTAVAPVDDAPPTDEHGAPALFSGDEAAPVAKKATRKRAAKKSPSSAEPVEATAEVTAPVEQPSAEPTAAGVFAAPVFQAPVPPAVRKRVTRPEPADEDEAGSRDSGDQVDDESDDETPARRRRRRGGRRRRKPGVGEDGVESSDEIDESDATDTDKHTSANKNTGKKKKQEAATGSSDLADDSEDTEGGTTRRRRRRRRRGEDPDGTPDDPANTVVRVREARAVEDEITSVSGSTRLEAKKQRRREGREAGRRRAPIVSEAEFLARRESVKREMVIAQNKDLTQIAVIEDDVLVEHYVARESQTSLIGNVYLGRVQNVLPSMEAAFVDIGKGRNAVLYAGEVDWKSLGNGKQRKIEEVLKSGQTVLVQVTKDPIGHKGARLTSQVSLAGRFLVYVPGGQTSGISRKLPDTERSRLKSLLKDVLPEEAGVIIRTAAEGATEDQLTRDVTALTARWDDIERKAASGNSPQLLYGEPDLTIKVVRDLFNEDFVKLVVQGADAWDMIQGYVQHVAPDLAERLERWSDDEPKNAFQAYRIDEQIAKGLDRKVWLPSGGSLVIDRTEAMTVVDVNTGKFTGSGGNLEETVTKNNLEAAEEIVRQLRLRDIGGIIVIDFIDMVLESNRDLVLRRLVECLGRDRTRHQVAEVTSLGLVQMTRKRIGTGLLEAFSEACEHCHGRGLLTHTEPVEPHRGDDAPARANRRRGGKGGGQQPAVQDHSSSASGPDAEPEPEAVPEPAEAVLTSEGQAP